MSEMKVNVPFSHETLVIEAIHISPFLADLLSPGGYNAALNASSEAPASITAREDVTPMSLTMLAQNAGSHILGSELRGVTI
jgi:hypothetical protein